MFTTIIFCFQALAVDLAHVNGVSINEEQLFEASSSIREDMRRKVLGHPELKRKMLGYAIDRELLVTAALKEGFDRKIAVKLEDVRKRTLSTNFVATKIAQSLTPKALKAFYDTHKKDYADDSVRLQHIVVWEKDLATKVLALAKEPGNDFQHLAEIYSIDPIAKTARGDLGYISRAQLDPAILHLAMISKIDEVAGPILMLDGYHIIKVKDRRYGDTLSYGVVESRVLVDARQDAERQFLESIRGTSTVNYK